MTRSYTSKVAFLNCIKKRTKNNRNAVVMVVGDPGTGKSWSSIEMCEELDPTFDSTRIMFGIVDLMRAIDSNKFPPGSCVILEEVGVIANNKRWYDKFVKALGDVLQTWRHKRIILFINAPDAGEVAKSVNRRIDFLLETLSIDYKNKEVIIKPLSVQVNKTSGKVYYKYLRRVTGRGPVKIKRIRVGLPSRDLLKYYENEKTGYTSRLYRKRIDELKEPTDLTWKQREVYELLQKGYNGVYISGKLGKTQSLVYRMIRDIKKKGYAVDSTNSTIKLPSA